MEFDTLPIWIQDAFNSVRPEGYEWMGDVEIGWGVIAPPRQTKHSYSGVQIYTLHDDPCTPTEGSWRVIARATNGTDRRKYAVHLTADQIRAEGLSDLVHPVWRYLWDKESGAKE